MHKRNHLAVAVLALVMTGCFGGSGSSDDTGSTSGDNALTDNTSDDDAAQGDAQEPEFAQLQMVGPFDVPRNHANDRPIKDTVHAHANDQGLAAVVWLQYDHASDGEIARFIKGDLESQQWDESSLDNAPLLGDPKAVYVTQDGAIVVLTRWNSSGTLPKSGTYAWHYNSETGWDAPLHISDNTINWALPGDAADQLVVGARETILRYRDGDWETMANLPNWGFNPAMSSSGHIAFLVDNADEDRVELKRSGPSGEIDDASFPIELPRGTLHAATSVGDDGAVAIAWNSGEKIKLVQVPGMDKAPDPAQVVFDFEAQGLQFSNLRSVDVAHTPDGKLVVVAGEGHRIHTAGPLHIFTSSDQGETWEHEIKDLRPGTNISLQINKSGQWIINVGRCRSSASQQEVIKRNAEGLWSDTHACMGSATGYTRGSHSITPLKQHGGAIAVHRSLSASETSPEFSGSGASPATRSEQQMRLWFYR